MAVAGGTLLLVAGYVGIGVLIAANHLSRGKVGTAGPIATFVAVTMFWPIILSGSDQ